ncbi:MAG: TraR/DksA family transcriptional regulator, partial [Gammaproteobacteria bacterium]
LLQLKAELLEDQQSSRESTRPVILDQTTVGRLSRMDAMQGQQMALETARRRQHLLLKVEGALRNIESGEYGYCFVCDEEIDIRRLQADPTNTRCIKCVDV